MSSFKGTDYFGSGPHRFTLGWRGLIFRFPLSSPNSTLGVEWYGTEPLIITQEGRLVAPSAPALWALVDAVVAESESGVAGELIDDTGRSWLDVTMLRFAAQGPVQRGASWSLAYQVRYAVATQSVF